MTTFTTRWGFPQIVISPTSDNVDVVTDFNTPWLTLDTKLYGTCTSSTRPSSPVQGQHTFETDTGFTRVWTGSAWKTAGNAVGTSGARPASPIQGDEFYETDTGYSRSRGSLAWNGFLPVCTVSTLPSNPIAGDLVYLSDKECPARYTGSQWHTTGPVICTSSTHPSATGITLYNGMLIYETDTLRFLIYNGTTFVVQTAANFVCTSSTHPSFPFTGLEIFETDTGFNAVYNGSNYMYGIQQLAPTQSVSAAGSVTFTGVPAVNRLLLVWRLRSTTSGTTLGLQLDNDTTSGHYVWAKVTGRAAAASASASSGDTSAQIGTVAGNSTTNYFSSGETWLNGWNSTNGFCNIDSTSSCWDTSSSYWIDKMGSQFIATAAAHTSLKVVPGSGTLTGEVTLYGGF